MYERFIKLDTCLNESGTSVGWNSSVSSSVIGSQACWICHLVAI